MLLKGLFVLLNIVSTIQGVRIEESLDVPLTPLNISIYDNKNVTQNATQIVPVAPCVPVAAEKQKDPYDFATLVKNYTAKQGPFDDTDWRTGLGFAEALTYMSNNSKLTDCTFIVGPDGETEEIAAHSVILAAASPVFETALKNSNTIFRIKEWTPSEFRMLLNYIYSGKTCIKDFDEACALLKLASSIGLSAASKAAQDYITYNMYPNKLWYAYLCAKDAKDLKLLQTANKFIGASTSKALMDPKFTSISLEDLKNFVMRDDLSIKSEVEIFEAATRWALKQISAKGMKTTPKLIRQTLGAVVVKNIRFLTMSNTEFSKINVNARILDYEEGLSVFLFMNSPEGSVDLPKTLGNNTEKRKPQTDDSETFQSFAPLSCDSSLDGTDYYDYYSSLTIPNMNEWKLIGMQIPKSMENRRNCKGKEVFDVHILNANNTIVNKFKYNEVPPCTSFRSWYKNNQGVTSFTDEMLIDVKFSSIVAIPKPTSEVDRYRIKVVFSDSKEYPRWVESHNSTKTGSFDQTATFKGERKVYRTFYEKSFIYALIFA